MTPKAQKRQLQTLLRKWQKGELSKVQIERDVFGVTTARGKFITRLWAKELGLDTRYEGRLAIPIDSINK